MERIYARPTRRAVLSGALAGSALAAAGCNAMPAAAKRFELEELPYAEDALDPWITPRTISFHYGKHHAGYCDKLNDAIEGTSMVDDALEDIIRRTADDPARRKTFDAAAQFWNHTFYWRCMKKRGGKRPSGELETKLEATFGSVTRFEARFRDAALSRFGSGWAWLYRDGNDLRVESTSNADTPLARGHQPLLVIDVWEHAYYLDYQNRRADYVADFLEHLVDWDFVEANYAAG